MALSPSKRKVIGMWNEPTEEELRKLPKLYETEPTPLQDKTVHMHFFVGGCDWYAVEYDPTKRVFFGFVILHNDVQNAEWGYFILDELRRLKVGPFEVERDLYCEPCKAEEVEKIAEACGWKNETARR